MPADKATSQQNMLGLCEPGVARLSSQHWAGLLIYSSFLHWVLWNNCPICITTGPLCLFYLALDVGMTIRALVHDWESL
ncbi:hypothetical protein Pelo_16625 [Pelomyxa schiedti]|nr:hypothetical protein Pelo_16625 [Pelomyxa schiedti]